MLVSVPLYKNTVLAGVLIATGLLSGCGGGTAAGAPTGTPPVAGPGDNNSGGSPVTEQNVTAAFSSGVQPLLGYCRTCHIPGGVGDTPEGRNFMLSSHVADDYSNMQTSWAALGQGVATNPILTMNSVAAEGHSGGTPWQVDSTAYKAVAAILACWDDPQSCNTGDTGEAEELLPLLGSARGGHFWDDYCNGLVDAEGVRAFTDDGEYLSVAEATPRPDSTVLPADPRNMVRAGIGENSAVAFNAFWRDCHAVPEIVNEFPHPKTCGDLRASVARGAIIMGDPAVSATDAEGNPYRYGSYEPYQRSDGKPSIYKGHYSEGEVIRPGSTFAGDNPHGFAAIRASQFNVLWTVWGLTARPDNFEVLLAERYGFGQPVASNPYPIVDPANGIDETSQLTASFGGSGQLPVGLLQTRMPDGTYSGEISQNCQGCHGSQVGDSFAVGAGGGMLDANVSSRDFSAMGSAAGIAIDRAGFAGRVRGTNNAQFSNILAATGVRGPQEFLDVMQNGSTGTGDTPAWWNVGRRPVKFVDAMFPGDAVRVDFALFSPLLTDKYGPLGVSDSARDDRWVSDHVQDGDHYIITRKAPKYPLPINKDLARQGAVLFHTKNLWADSKQQSVPRPDRGNGSCASCHGAYSPRFVNDPDYLPDPRLEGIASYVVPMDIIGTDPVRSETYNPGTESGLSQASVGYPETAPGSNERASLPPEEEAKVEDCRVQNMPGLQKDAQGNERPRGYAAPPLYGVWATAPYLHNGSIPSMEALLNSEARPEIWRRVSTPTPAGQENVVMGFDYDLNRAYDQQNMGWRYEALECGGSDFAPALDCTPLEQGPFKSILDGLYSGLLMGWNVTNPPVIRKEDIEARKIYNTSMWSQGNGGHTFSDVLNEQERRAIIEYLKTL